MKKKTKSKAIKDLYLDRPTSHGGWPGGHSGSYTDADTPVYKQIANYLKSMGVADDDNPRARLSESNQKFNMFNALDTRNPIGKVVYAIVRAVHATNSAEALHSHAYQMIQLVSSLILLEAPITEQQSWYLSAAILRYHEKMIDYKEKLKQSFENNRHKTGNYSGHFFDSPDMDKWREINAKQVQFHREVESMIGVWEHQGSPDIHHQVVFPSDVDDLKARFVSAGLADVNDGTWVGRYGNPPERLDKRSLYSDAFYRGEERYFINENKIRNIIRDSIKRLL